MTVAPTIPLDAAGAHHGYLRLPYSRDDSAWGAVMIPFSVITGGAGPTALFCAGNHGDEYEGPLALHALARTLDPGRLRGRAIVLPSMNHPAVVAGRRCSPIDGGNLNRSFPGDAGGTVTEKIADYVLTRLVPEADLVADLHSGGRTLDFLPFAAAHVLDDTRQQAACVAAMRAFGAPYSVILREIDAAGMFDTAVEALGKTFVTTELGGGGTTTAARVAIARRGLRNLLIHGGLIDEAPEHVESRPLAMPAADCFTFAETAGLCEPLVDLGAQVAAGQPVARIWPVEHTGRSPSEAVAGRAGLLVGRHFPGLVQLGDCLAVAAEPDTGA